MDAIQIDDGVQGFQRAGLPSLDVLDDRVDDRGNECRRTGFDDKILSV